METTKQLQSMNMRTGKTKALTKSAKSILLLLAMLVMGQAEAWAQKALQYDYGFEDNNLATDGWTILNPGNNNASKIKISSDAKQSGSYGFQFSSYDGGTANQLLISPELSCPSGVEVNFAYKSYKSGSYYTETFRVGYSTTTADEASFTWSETISENSATWKTYENTFPAGTKYIAVNYTTYNQYYLYVDDFTFSAPTSCVKPTGLTTSDITSSSVTMNWTSEADAWNIQYKKAADADWIVMSGITSNPYILSGLETYTEYQVRVQADCGSGEVSKWSDAVAFTTKFGTITVDADNQYSENFNAGSMPAGWNVIKNGNYGWNVSSNMAYSGYYGDVYLIMPPIQLSVASQLNFDNYFDYVSDYNKSSVVISTTGTETSDFSTTLYTFTKDELPSSSSIPLPKEISLAAYTGQTVYIAFKYEGSNDHAWYVDNVVVKEQANEPRMEVTQPASLDYGVISTATAKTFTIANTGLATLKGINVTSSNAAFAVTGAPASLDAGASQEVTITMSAETTGALSSDITVSATGMENVVFTVKGVVLPDGMPVEEFSGTTIPTNWTSSGSWNFATDGLATGTSSSAYLYTPKLKFSAGDFLVIKMAPSDSYSGDYLTIDGSDNNGSTYTAYTKKLEMPQGKDVYATYVVSDIPTTINKIRFTGYYVNVDEISGLTYAPVLSVTTGDPAATVETPAAYDFGECAANATVTYNFANAGAGTINITNVAITGDGAAAYSTNWTESTACPYSLTITRTYDASRAGAGAQAAVVTVTTTEGEFVINVKGTDKAANAPELAVKLGEDAVTTGDAADFGSKLQAAPAAKTYTITNTGTGTLTGTITTSDDSQFTVSKTSFSLAAAESTTFDVALVFNTTYGTKAATITIHPTVDGLADVVINATASTLDPEAWTEDFEAGSLPMGWASSNWTIETNTIYENKTTMALAPSSYTAGTITTPCLTAKKDDVLTWDGYFNWSDEAMTVEYSNDLVTWTKIYDAYKAESDFGSTRYNHKEMSFTAPADGDYYLRFTSTYSNGIDNFAGFKLNLPDHIMNITASSIPTSGSYSPTMKATKSFNATVTVKESRGIAESGVVAKLYMGSTVIGTSDATNFDANESKVINISATPTEAAVDGIEMHIEVEYAGGTLSTTPETRYVAEFVRLDMTENSEPTITTGYSAVYDVVTLTRSFASGWNTFVSPVAVNINDIHAEAIAYSFTGYNEGELSFTKVTTGSLNVATPYIIYVPEAIATKTFTWETPVIYSSYVGEDNIKTTLGGATLQGTYAPIAEGGLTGNYGVTSEGKIQKAGASAKIKGFRAYFKLPAGVTAPSLSVQDQTTGITTIVSEGSQQNGEVYNLNGQKVNTPSKGLYIINGRKVVVK